MSKLNLDIYSKDSEITIGGEEYKIPPVTYKLAIEFGKIKENDIEAVTKLIAKYLSTNKEGVVFEVEKIEELLSMKQIAELMKFIVSEIAETEKN